MERRHTTLSCGTVFARITLLVLVSFVLQAGPAAAQPAPAGAANADPYAGLDLMGVSSGQTTGGPTAVQPVATPPPRPPQAAQPLQDGAIQLAMYGGYGRLERLTVRIAPSADGARVVLVRKPYDRDPITANGQLSPTELEALWKTLLAHKVLTLKDNVRLRGKVTDMYTFEVTATRGGRSNRFQVYGPEVLGNRDFDRGFFAAIRSIFPNDDAHYLAVVEAITAQSDRMAAKEEPDPEAF